MRDVITLLKILRTAVTDDRPGGYTGHHRRRRRVITPVALLPVALAVAATLTFILAPVAVGHMVPDPPTTPTGRHTGDVDDRWFDGSTYRKTRSGIE